MKRVLCTLALVAASACADTGAEGGREGGESRRATAVEAPETVPPGVDAGADTAGPATPQPAGPGAGEDTGTAPPPRGDSAGTADPASDREPAPGAPDPYAILERASAAYEALESIQADFRQEARNPLLRRTVRSRGTLYQRQPDLFLMRFQEPAGDVIVSDGDHLWVYYPSVDSAQVLRMPAARGAGATDLRSQFIGDPAERFRATLRGEDAVAGRPADVLVLEPRRDEPYRTLVAWIDRADGLARRFEITETNGLVRRFELSAVRRDPALADSLFRFDVPQGVRVVDRG